MDYLSLLVDLAKITIPALIVYYTAKNLFGKQMSTLIHLQNQHNKAKESKDFIPMKLQAYERLTVFCERMSIPNLLMRLQESGQNSKELKLALLLAVEQEYEHNLSQQIYLSHSLWEIIKTVKDNVLQTIDTVADSIDQNASGMELGKQLLKEAAPTVQVSIETAQKAIKKEVALVLR